MPGSSLINIRHLQPADDALMAMIIRQTLKEFGLDKPGTVYFDESTDRLSDLFSEKKSSYLVATDSSRVIGGAGIFPTAGLPVGTAELVKMYLLPDYRGRSIGAELLKQCINMAKKLGYDSLYLETMPELKTAISLYQKMEFHLLSKPLGNSGHHHCTIWMQKHLSA